jgi:hypothetical protein
MLAMPPVVTSVARARALGVSSVGEQATLLLTVVPGGLERFFVPRDGERPDPAAFGLTFPETGRGGRRVAPRCGGLALRCGRLAVRSGAFAPRPGGRTLASSGSVRSEGT